MGDSLDSNLTIVGCEETSEDKLGDWWPPPTEIWRKATLLRNPLFILITTHNNLEEHTHKKKMKIIVDERSGEARGKIGSKSFWKKLVHR